VAGSAVQTLETQGVDAFISQIGSTSSVEADVDALIDELKAMRTRTLGQVSTLIDGYGYAFDAIAASQFAQRLFAQAEELYQDEGIDSALGPALTGAAFYSIVDTQVDAA
jgi:hypothetical protein